jgi:choline dehydrogenase-like flavoprotein
MGGCVMGTDPKRSVVNPEYNVHGEKTLYITDSSIYPNAPGINPGLTIKALSHRLSKQLLRE